MENKITKEDIEKLEVIQRELEVIQRKEEQITSKIESRVDFIVKKIISLFGKRLDWYGYANGGDDGGFFDVQRYKETVDLNIYVVGGTDLVVIIEEGEWGLEQGFPTRWLFEDFEEEVKEGIAKYKIQKEAQKQKEKELRIQRKEKDLLLAKEARNKLTKEEIKALKATL